MPHTVSLHRVVGTKPEKIYRAFLEADALAKWLPPNGFTCTVHELVAKAGGQFRMSFRNFTTGDSQSFGGEYLELAPYERIRYTDKFDDPNLPGQIQVTVTLKNGRVFTRRVTDFKGTPESPLNAEEMREKFLLLTKHCDAREMARMFERIQNLENEHTLDFVKASAPKRPLKGAKKK